MPGVARSLRSSDAGRRDRVRSEAPSWKTPKSERPTWIRSPAVRRTPAAIESSATMSATPIATPADVSAVRTGRRIRFRQTSPGQVTTDIQTWGEIVAQSSPSRHTRVAAGKLGSLRARGWSTAPLPSGGGADRGTAVSARKGAGNLRSMGPDRGAIWSALERVIDPELRRPVTDLDMVRSVEVDGGDVSVTIALTVAGCPLRASFQDQVAEHVGAVSGVERTHVAFDVMSPEEKAALTTKLRGG